MKQAESKNLWKVKIFEWGSFALDGGAMFGTVPKTLWSRVSPSDDENRIPLALRSLYLEKGPFKVLVDLGMGNTWDEKFQKIFKLETSTLEHTLSSKVQANPLDITHVLLTHLHFDHCGFLSVPGTTENKNATAWTSAFPNAEIFLTKAHFEYARSPSPREQASFRPELWRDPAQRGQIKLIDCEWMEFREVLPGISFRRVDGHTVGQAIVYVEGEDKNYLFLSDLCPTQNHRKETWVMGYDTNPGLSVVEKLRIFGENETQSRELVFQHQP